MSCSINNDEKRATALTNAVRESNRQPGQELPNGATIIADRFVGDDTYAERHIVLAVKQGFQPYAVWTRFIGIADKATGGYESLDYCVWGHYFRDLDEAVRDLNEAAHAFKSGDLS